MPDAAPPRGRRPAPARSASKPAPRRKPAEKSRAEKSKLVARRKPATRTKAAPTTRAAAPARQLRAPKPPDPARRRAVARGALLSVLLVGVLFAFVYPTQTFLDQRSATTKASEQLDLLRSENAKLADATKRLQNDDEIARIARESYGLVKPGEQPFVILPAPTTTTAPPVPASKGEGAKPTP